MLGSLILYLKGMRTIMFQLSGFYCKPLAAHPRGLRLWESTLQSVGFPLQLVVLGSSVRVCNALTVNSKP